MADSWAQSLCRSDTWEEGHLAEVMPLSCGSLNAMTSGDKGVTALASLPEFEPTRRAIPAPTGPAAVLPSGLLLPLPLRSWPWECSQQTSCSRIFSETAACHTPPQCPVPFGVPILSPPWQSQPVTVLWICISLVKSNAKVKSFRTEHSPTLDSKDLSELNISGLDLALGLA